MLNERNINERCKEYGFGCNYFGDTAIITTGVDQWQLISKTVYDKNVGIYVDKVMLKHKNARGNRSGKAHYHKQRLVCNTNQAFKIIISHQENCRDFNKAFEIKNSLKVI